MGRRTLVLVIALILAVVSAVAVWQFLTNVESDVQADLQLVQVYRAVQPIEQGTEGEIARDFIEQDQALAEAVAFEGSTILCTGPVADSAADPTACDTNPSNLEDVLNGKLAAGPISQGQLITQEMFVTAAELNTVFLSEDVPAGKVAISIRPSEDSAVGGFVRPGDRVNLLASAAIQLSQLVDLVSNPELRNLIIDTGLGQQQDTTPPATEGEGGTTEEQPEDPLTQFVQTLPPQINFTQTVLQDIEVIAVGADTRQAPIGTGLEPQGSQIVVLEVTPEQAEKIEFAKQYTSVALSLLPKDEPYTEFEARGVLVDDLFSLLDRIEEELTAVGAALGS